VAQLLTNRFFFTFDFDRKINQNKSRMKTTVIRLLLALTILISGNLAAVAQTETLPTSTAQKAIFKVEKNDGTKYIGEIVSRDAREVLIRTENLGEIIIPMHEVGSIVEITEQIKPGQIFKDDELFSTRYFITTNGLPIKKGDNYMIWNLWGPDFQFGVADNFGVGVMTTWLAIPIVFTAKYSIELGPKTSMAIGGLAGTGSWALPKFGLAVPYTAFTYGNRTHNISMSVGYGGVFYTLDDYNYQTGYATEKPYREGRFLFSIAGMAKINENLSLVFDSFVMPRGAYRDVTEVVYQDHWDANGNYSMTSQVITTRERTPNLALIMPGIRWQMDKNKAFQFGFTGFYLDNEFMPAPIPTVQWFRKL
jgi:hypothetical protein